MRTVEIIKYNICVYIFISKNNENLVKYNFYYYLTLYTIKMDKNL